MAMKRVFILSFVCVLKVTEPAALTWSATVERGAVLQSDVETRVTAEISQTTNSTITFLKQLGESGWSRTKVFDFFSTAMQIQNADKIVLAIIEVSGLGIFAVDRFYMGQIGLGILKLITLPCCIGFVWSFVDYLYILVNCLSCKDHIDGFGFHANFHPDQVYAAFWIMLLGFLFHSVCCVTSCIKVPACVSFVRKQGKATSSRGSTQR